MRGAPVAVVVEPGLADRHALLVRRQRLQLGKVGIVETGGFIRVAADRRVHLREVLGRLQAPRGTRRPSVPTVRIRVTPASTAAATSSASGGSQNSRWVWLSIIGGPLSALGEQRLERADRGAATALGERARPNSVSGAPSAPSSRSVVAGMYGCSSTLTARRPSASEASVSSSLSAASAGSSASCHGARSST